MKALVMPNALVAATLVASCVTINIYFPAAAAEKAADKIIDEVWQLQQGQQNTPKDAPKFQELTDKKETK
jgi:hypothetical protein